MAIVKQEAAHAKTLFIGDGINDAPAMMARDGRRGVRPRQRRRMRTSALQRAIGGMAVSILGMIAALLRYLSPVGGAVTQEIIDLFAVLNAVRVALPFKELTDF